MTDTSLPARLAPRLSGGTRLLAALVRMAIRAVALVLFLLLSLAEPFLAVVLGALSLGCFAVSVFFGFILHAYFPHRWFVLGASGFFLGCHLVFGLLLRGVARLLP